MNQVGVPLQPDGQGGQEAKHQAAPQQASQQLSGQQYIGQAG